MNDKIKLEDDLPLRWTVLKKNSFVSMKNLQQWISQNSDKQQKLLEANKKTNRTKKTFSGADEQKRALLCVVLLWHKTCVNWFVNYHFILVYANLFSLKMPLNLSPFDCLKYRATYLWMQPSDLSIYTCHTQTERVWTKIVLESFRWCGLKGRRQHTNKEATIRMLHCELLLKSYEA